MMCFICCVWISDNVLYLLCLKFWWCALFVVFEILMMYFICCVWNSDDVLYLLCLKLWWCALFVVLKFWWCALFVVFEILMMCFIYRVLKFWLMRVICCVWNAGWCALCFICCVWNSDRCAYLLCLKFWWCALFVVFEILMMCFIFCLKFWLSIILKSGLTVYFMVSYSYIILQV